MLRSKRFHSVGRLLQLRLERYFKWDAIDGGSKTCTGYTFIHAVDKKKFWILSCNLNKWLKIKYKIGPRVGGYMLASLRLWIAKQYNIISRIHWRQPTYSAAGAAAHAFFCTHKTQWQWVINALSQQQQPLTTSQYICVNKFQVCSTSTSI